MSVTVKHAVLPKNIVILQKICVPYCQIRPVNIQMDKIKIQEGVYVEIWHVKILRMPVAAFIVL